MRRTIVDFLFSESLRARPKPGEASFVKGEQEMMTRIDIDNGRLVYLIGVAALRPAEFVIFRIGQWTAELRYRRREIGDASTRWARADGVQSGVQSERN